MVEVSSSLVSTSVSRTCLSVAPAKPYFFCLSNGCIVSDVALAANFRNPSFVNTLAKGSVASTCPHDDVPIDLKSLGAF